MKKCLTLVQALFLFAITLVLASGAGAVDPHFTVDVSPVSPTVIKGQKLELIVTVSFANGFTTSGGISFSVHDPTDRLDLLTSFFSEPLKTPGHVVAEIDTASLAPGNHIGGIMATEAGYVPLPAPFDFTVVAVGSINLWRTDWQGNRLEEVTGFTATRQGQVETFDITAEVKDTGGNVIADAPVTVTSANPSVVAVYPNQYGGHDVYAVATGSTDVVFATPDGFSATFPATVTIPETPQVTGISLTPMTVTNARTETIYFAATATHLIGYGMQGLLALIEDNRSWSPDYKSVSGTFKLDLTTPPDPGTTLFNASTGDGVASAMRVIPLTIENDPSYAAVSGAVKSVSSGLPTFALGHFTLEFCDPASGAVLFSRDSHSYTHTEPRFTIGAIVPGTYKIRYVPMPTIKPQWYPNADDIADAAPVTFTAGATVAPVYFFARATLMGDINTDGTVGLDDAIAGLRILTGPAPVLTSPAGADVNGDGRIGMPEVVYVLQKTAGLRN